MLTSGNLSINQRLPRRDLTLRRGTKLIPLGDSRHFRQPGVITMRVRGVHHPKNTLPRIIELYQEVRGRIRGAHTVTERNSRHMNLTLPLLGGRSIRGGCVIFFTLNHCRGSLGLLCSRRRNIGGLFISERTTSTESTQQEDTCRRRSTKLLNM